MCVVVRFVLWACDSLTFGGLRQGAKRRKQRSSEAKKEKVAGEAMKCGPPVVLYKVSFLVIHVTMGNQFSLLFYFIPFLITHLPSSKGQLNFEKRPLNRKTDIK